ncbi:PH domain-containing protein [Streptomyces sp. TS71-3]|uniref:PH domain-containing protein n=1 Tax=Streptomyces sp. TS71-3 TaxID=2733862 RepID=UPI002016C10E|nr:PH domain-containing protein [Streptomyces sp. TS71-3]
MPVTFRPAVTRAVLLIGGVALFVVLTAVALMLPDLRTAERVSFIVTAALLLAGPVVLSRPKIVADGSGVTVVNILSGRRLDWAEIVQVNLRHGDPWVFLNLSDGTSLPALGIQPGLARRRAIEDARVLRALVDAHTAVEREPGARHD